MSDPTDPRPHRVAHRGQIENLVARELDTRTLAPAPTALGYVRTNHITAGTERPCASKGEGRWEEEYVIRPTNHAIRVRGECLKRKAERIAFEAAEDAETTQDNP